MLCPAAEGGAAPIAEVRPLADSRLVFAHGLISIFALSQGGIVDFAALFKKQIQRLALGGARIQSVLKSVLDHRTSVPRLAR